MRNEFEIKAIVNYLKNAGIGFVNLHPYFNEASECYDYCIKFTFNNNIVYVSTSDYPKGCNLSANIMSAVSSFKDNVVDAYNADYRFRSLIQQQIFDKRCYESEGRVMHYVTALSNFCDEILKNYNVDSFLENFNSLDLSGIFVEDDA